jgi:hypothetical protein
MPSNFFQIQTRGNSNQMIAKIWQNNCDSLRLDPFVTKLNKFFTKIKFPFGRYIRITISNSDEPISIDNPMKGVYWAINVEYSNYPIESLFEMSNAERMEAITKVMYDVSKLVFAKFNVDFNEMELCFERLWNSDYTNYDSRVSRVYTSPNKTYKVYLWHEIVIGHTDIFLIIENKVTSTKNKMLIYSINYWIDGSIDYLSYSPRWLSETLFSLSTQTGEVTHIFDLDNYTFRVEFTPLENSNLELLKLRLDYFATNDNTEKKLIDKKIDLEYKKMQEQIWLSARGKY